MKMKTVTYSLLLLFSILTAPVLAQEIEKETLIGTWEIRGTLMGDDGTGWLLPHKQANLDCGADHTLFSADHTAKEVKYNGDCASGETALEWKLDDNILTLTKGERSIRWHIKSIEEGKMIVGVQVRLDSENKMYVVYHKRD